MILPILCYGSELWGFHKAVDIERVHTKVLKQLLLGNKQVMYVSMVRLVVFRYMFTDKYE